jgi:energy-coupling factor transporter ATP-binding protein EcfA2
MKIESVTISNFRCFGPEPTPLALESAVTAFVGNNGSGKTAIFAALSRMFGTTAAQRTIKKSDFHVPADQEQIGDGSSLYVDCVFGFPELENDANADAVPEVFGHMSVAEQGGALKARIRLKATWTDDGTPEGSIEEELRWIAALDDAFEWSECQKVSAIERNFVQLIYVPASRNASDQVTNLLKGRLWRAARWSGAFTTAAADSAHALQGQFDQEAPSTFIIERLQRRWNQVHQGDTDAQPILRLVESELSELVKRAEFAFAPDAALQFRRLEDLSDGQRSLFHIALTAATLEMERDALGADPQTSVFDQEKLRRTYLTILAIEEPENSLAPFFLSRIMLQAREIGGMASAQVAISSHSPSILSRIEPEEVRHTRLDPTARRSSVQALQLPAGDPDARRYVRLAVKAFPEIYFARFVILAEGDSEQIVIPWLAEQLDFPLDRAFVPIVPLGGRFVSHFWRLLENLGTPYATLLDLDAGRQHGGKNTIAYVVGELAAIGRDLQDNPSVILGEIDPAAIDHIDEADLVTSDQAHPWLTALRRENVFFSSPIDLDFAMLLCFQGAYKVARPGGHGPRLGPNDIASKKAVTLKTEGKPALYDAEWDHAFGWYPYLFLSASKPEAHITALSRIEDADAAPEELVQLVQHVRATILR